MAPMTPARGTQPNPRRPPGRPAERLAGMGTTIFAEMSAAAVAHDAVNLGQGFPDKDGPVQVIEAAVAALRSGTHNQYAPGSGIPELRRAIATHQHHWWQQTLDPETDILVTTGATEAIAAAMLGSIPNDFATPSPRAPESYSSTRHTIRPEPC